MSGHHYYVAADGDLVGRKIEQLIVLGDLEQLKQYSGAVNEAIDYLQAVAEEFGGRLYLKGGDSVLIEISSYRALLTKIALHKNDLPVTFSFGIGQTTLEAYLALKYAKSVGRGQAIEAILNGQAVNFQRLDF